MKFFVCFFVENMSEHPNGCKLTQVFYVITRLPISQHSERVPLTVNLC